MVAAGGQFADVAEPPIDDMRSWLEEQGVADLIEEQHTRRAFLAFSRCPFGERVTPSLRRDFLRAIAPYVDHLAIQQLDMGCFTNPKYVMHIELKDLSPIQ